MVMQSLIIRKRCLISSGILYPKPAWLEIRNLAQQLSVPMFIAEIPYTWRMPSYSLKQEGIIALTKGGRMKCDNRKPM